ncbi:hypothetical protein [Nocardiopsis sp. L17-MgMaSL7]|uniref:hypothetical protein n=1 Tax=Nocardiopsis sp. L17-MgMaSL7 TaxID=1938893 RepID=UPI000D83F60E|nr:hypothetical protein [Nocardiopsis sp. L17-MgMaSL7]PWV57943.1 hypothetical protein BDW27_101178 [Nocardiopsis sp. L17-MgMaSL7]
MREHGDEYVVAATGGLLDRLLTVDLLGLLELLPVTGLGLRLHGLGLLELRLAVPLGGVAGLSLVSGWLTPGGLCAALLGLRLRLAPGRLLRLRLATGRLAPGRLRAALLRLAVRLSRGLAPVRLLRLAGRRLLPTGLGLLGLAVALGLRGLRPRLVPTGLSTGRRWAVRLRLFLRLSPCGLCAAGLLGRLRLTAGVGSPAGLCLGWLCRLGLAVGLRLRGLCSGLAPSGLGLLRVAAGYSPCGLCAAGLLGCLGLAAGVGSPAGLCLGWLCWLGLAVGLGLRGLCPGLAPSGLGLLRVAAGYSPCGLCAAGLLGCLGLAARAVTPSRLRTARLRLRRLGLAVGLRLRGVAGLLRPLRLASGGLPPGGLSPALLLTVGLRVGLAPTGLRAALLCGLLRRLPLSLRVVR